MAIMLTTDQVEAVLQRGSSDLKFLLAREVFSEVRQAKFFHVDIAFTAKFAAIIKRQTILQTIGLTGSMNIYGSLFVQSERKFLVLEEIHTTASELFSEIQAKKQAKTLPGRVARIKVTDRLEWRSPW